MEEELRSSMAEDEAGEFEFAGFDPTKKKKKKQQRRRLEDDQVEEGFLDEQGSNPNIYESQSDYEYYELLERMLDKNPEFGGRRRAVLTPPLVKADDKTKSRSIWVNFIPICKQMHRQPDHVMRFFLAELGTTGSLDGQQRLVFKYRFNSEMVFEKILKKYAKYYVMCNACNSMDTLLSKEDRLNFVRCEKCGSGRTVERIEFGFNANAARERRRAAP